MMIEDKELGRMLLVPNARAQRVVARVRNGELRITHPAYISTQELQKSIDSMRPQLLGLLQRAKPKFVLTPDAESKTLTFSVQIVLSNLTHIYTSLADGVLRISVPHHADLKGEDIQVMLQHLVEAYMRKEAARVFPGKVKYFAEQYGFTFSDVKINKSRSRWGSCSMRKSINLSYFCLLLPEHLIDYIILHELCHTVEMNHGEGFWRLMDKVTDEKAKPLSKELKETSIAWF